MRVCVFCSSSTAAADDLVAVASRAGAALAARGHSLVYGGTAVGAMAELAAAARAGGARVTGVLPEAWVERGLVDDACDEVVATVTLAERKTAMITRSDAFLAVPGGLGTLDELLEVVTQKQLGLHTAPIAVVGIGGFWDPLAALLDDLAVRSLARDRDELLWLGDDLEPALDHLESGGPPPPTPWHA